MNFKLLLETNKTRYGYGRRKAKKGILEWQIGDRSSKTFEKLWEKVKDWKCFFINKYSYLLSE